MRDARLNLLLTTPPRRGGYVAGQSWQQTMSQLLMPLGVRTFEADSGQAAVELMERHPIHLAVVDTRLPAIGGLNVLQLIQRLKEHGQRHFISVNSAQKVASPGETEAKNAYPEIKTGDAPLKNDNSGLNAVRFEMRMETRSHTGNTQQRFEVRIESRVVAGSPVPYAPGAPPPGTPQVGPVVILIAPPPAEQDRALLAEALKFNAFSVLSEPVDVDVALEVMARAMKRLFSGQWPA